jgi:uncharacterized Fe-S cluster protein YjdI
MDEERSGTKDREYSNDDITVFWKPSKCIHVTTCYREKIEVFNPRKRPWVNMQGASTEEIIRVVEMCPTEALSYKWKEGREKTSKELEPEGTKVVIEDIEAAEVRVMKDGPLVIKGKFRIVGSGGSELRHMKMASFCRCGQSQKMPFCDGTHRKIGFSGD